MKFFALLLFCLPLTGWAGFICNGSTLYSSRTTAAVTRYGSASDCDQALLASKNGFICNGSTLYGDRNDKNSSQAITRYGSESDCDQAVESSK